MLEKIGLPPKPALRGNNWVVDASHCQGCSSQFTFINRKHHCRRCGGLFCNSCTQQRILLRGQGDSPVRICEPCKKLEEAARFELRHGNKNRSGRGSKLTSRSDDEVLNQILGNDGKGLVSSGRGSATDMVSSIHRATSSASCSNVQEVATQDEGGEILRSLSVEEPNNMLMEMGSASPEELRQQAVDEKKKYKILKAEGKSEEALRAFKRGKELERQAGALELSLRKNRKRASSSINMIEIQKIKDDPNNSGRKNPLPPQKSKEKDDLAAELRDLGWSDMDMHNADRKKASMSLEGELSTLLGEVSQKPKTEKRAGGIDKAQIIAHKKKALALKREGKLAAAKEELKTAKVLEKQLEEQEFLAEFEDSDDELSSLIRSMDVDKQEDLSIRHELGTGFDVDDLVGLGDDLGIDNNFEVTDGDMDDPEMVDALKSLGWTEEGTHPEEVEPQLVPIDKEALLSEIQSLKREAVNKKRTGNIAEAMALLKKAKGLEKDLDNYDSQGTNFIEHSNKVGVRNVDGRKDMDRNLPPKSRGLIQKELLALKKRALALRREGRLEEADEELKKGKVLEQQLEEMDNASKFKVAQVNMSDKHADDFSTIDLEGEGDVTDHDMHDPTFLSLLSNLGWKDEEDEHVAVPSKASKESETPPLKISDTSVTQAPTTIQVGASRRSKGEIQRELLGLKRKALSLRRQGETEEADKVLEMAKVLEAQLAEIEVPNKEVRVEIDRRMGNEIISSPLKTTVDERDVSEEDMHDPALLSVMKNLGWNDQVETVTMQAEHSKPTASSSVHSDDLSMVPSSPEVLVVPPKRSNRDIQKEILGLKRKALALRRKGETEEAEEILRTATLLEAQMEEVEAPKKEQPFDGSNDKEPQSFGPQSVKDGVEVNKGTTQAAVGQNRKDVERPTSLGWNEKGTNNPPPRISDISIPVMARLEDLGPPGETRKAEGTGFILPSGQSASIMDLLTGDDWRNSQSSEKNVEDWGSQESVAYGKREETVDLNEKPHMDESNSVHLTVSQNDQASLRQEILAQKRRAVALKREGKLAEAREELRRAKLLEKSLEDVNNPQPGSGSSSVSISTPNAASSGQKEHSSSNLAPRPPGSSSVSRSTLDVASSGQKGHSSSNLAPKPLSSRDRFKIQQESLSHKRQALKLRREGRTEEADAEFELAKALETQLEELAGHNSTKSSVSGAEPVDDVGVEDLLDPQLLSALKAIGLEDASIVSRGPEKPEPAKPVVVKSENSIQERIELEERIKAEKVKAVNLKRSGKQAEALDALRRAKMLEKKLNS
ncbi:uncharacterized protein LOC132266802 [Cornus florida]|uniref:uncharacterized protein LOC132266802 n=1 Tax=Cornus florida TaxID=4283 RepID=UPI00289B46CD|nr:uncharacterized protein LOC132266802 [Cornus florida]